MARDTFAAIRDIVQPLDGRFTPREALMGVTGGVRLMIVGALLACLERRAGDDPPGRVVAGTDQMEICSGRMVVHFRPERRRWVG